MKKKKTLDPKKASRKRKNKLPITRSLIRRGNLRVGLVKDLPKGRNPIREGFVVAKERGLTDEA